MPTPPRLTDEQRRQAYEKALLLRQERATLKHYMRRGELAFAKAFEWDIAQGMKVVDLLAALPGVGKPTAVKLLERAGFRHPEKTTVRATGPRQREALFKLLDTKKPRR